MPHYVDVKPSLLRWAIERSRLPMEQFAERTQRWLSGEAKPTLNQLEEFARRAMVPIGYLFLAKPPKEEIPVPDYRTRRNGGVRRPSPNLIETIFEMQRRQDWMREYLVEEGHSNLRFVGSAKVGDEIRLVTRQMRTALDLTEVWAARQPNWEASLRVLRERIENAGILVFVNGIVGNNTKRKLDPDEFQGFVLVDKIAPLIFVNGADFKVAQMFTIAHELAHIWVGESALFELEATEPANVKLEKYCNAVAAEFLVPADKLERKWPTAPSGDATFSKLAHSFKVSPIVIARRAKDRKLITEDEFFAYYRRYVDRERRHAAKKSGGNFWLTQNLRLGRRFARAIIAAAKEGNLSYADAYDFTRLYGDTFDKYAWLLEKEEGV